MIRTRSATTADLGFLERTFVDTLRDAITGARGAWDEGRERRQFREQLLLEHTRVITHGDREVGFLTAVLEGHRLLLSTLCILHEHQCKGIGATVMADLMTEAAVRSAPLELYVLKANPRARAFYQRL